MVIHLVLLLLLSWIGFSWKILILICLALDVLWVFLIRVYHPEGDVVVGALFAGDQPDVAEYHGSQPDVAEYHGSLECTDFVWDDLVGGSLGNTYFTRHVWEQNGVLVHNNPYLIRCLPCTSNMLDNIIAEVNTQRSFRHPTFLSFQWWFFDEDYLYVVVKAPRCHIRTILPLTDERVGANFVKSIVEALIAAHQQGIRHRRVTIEKLFLNHDGEVKIADFGLAINEGYYQCTATNDTRDITNLIGSMFAGDLPPQVQLFLDGHYHSLQAMLNDPWLQ